MHKNLPSHDIQHSCFAHRGSLSLRQSNRRVARHEEMAARGGDERCHETNQVIIHVSRIAQGGSGSYE